MLGFGERWVFLEQTFGRGDVGYATVVVRTRFLVKVTCDPQVMLVAGPGCSVMGRALYGVDTRLTRGCLAYSSTGGWREAG